MEIYGKFCTVQEQDKKSNMEFKLYLQKSSSIFVAPWQRKILHAGMPVAGHVHIISVSLAKPY